MRDEARGEAADEAAEPVADRAIDAAQKEITDENPVRDARGLFVEGNPGGPGRPPGSKNVFPPGTKLALKELMEGRLLADGKTAAEILVEALLEGMQGKAAVVSDKHGRTTISPLGFIQTYMDYVSKHEALEAANAKEKGTGGGGIRIVLPNPVVDPLLKPGQTPRSSIAFCTGSTPIFPACVPIRSN